MATLVWGDPATRFFESGLDRGVLYLSNGKAVPWNGLTAVSSGQEQEQTIVYFDGDRSFGLVTSAGFKGTLSAVTYPDEFSSIIGYEAVRHGALISGQPADTFGLSYRTFVEAPGGKQHYKIHILCNVLATTSDVQYASLGSDPALVEFEFDLTGLVETVDGYGPVSEVVLDSRNIDPWLLEDLEELLYGGNSSEPTLPSTQELLDIINNWARVNVYDNGDGTWTAVSSRPGFIFYTTPANDEFKIVNVNARTIDDDTYSLSDTIDIEDVPQIKLIDHNNGLWSAMTDGDNVIKMISDTEFEIRNVTTIFSSDGMYRITDTVLTEE